MLSHCQHLWHKRTARTFQPGHLAWTGFNPRSLDQIVACAWCGSIRHCKICRLATSRLECRKKTRKAVRRARLHELPNAARATRTAFQVFLPHSSRLVASLLDMLLVQSCFGVIKITLPDW